MTLEQFITSNAPWFVPLVLLLLQAGLKLLIAEEFKGYNLWVAFLQSPVEIGFLSLSFMATILLSIPSKATTALTVSFLYILALAISITIWKKSPTGVVRNDIIMSCALGTLNFAITLPMLAYSVGILIGA